MEEKLEEMKIKERLNLYNLFDVAVIAAFVLLLIAISEKTSIKLKHALIGVGVAGIVGGVAASQKSKVTNLSNKPIYIKPENGRGAIKVEHGKTYYGVDGVRSYNTVYKFGDGMSAVVNEDGSLTVQSIMGNVFTHLRKCALSMPPDPYWNDLFKIECHEWNFKDEE